MKSAERMKYFRPSVFSRLDEEKRRLQEKGEKIIDFSIGSPDIAPAPHIMEALLKAAEDPANYRYAIHDLPRLQQAITDWYRRRYDVELDPCSEVITLQGSQEALANIALTLCDPGDIVLVPDPYYPIFAQGPKLAGADVRFMPMKEENDFLIRFDEISEEVAKKAVLMIVSYPNNPTGAILSEKTLAALGDFLRQKEALYAKEIYLISDEPYREIVYDGHRAAFPADYYEDTILCYSYSKSLSLPGERIGYILVSPRAKSREDLFAAICGAGRSLGYVCAPSLLQRVVAENQGARANFEIYARNRELLLTNLQSFGYSFIKPEGAFYLFLAAPDGDGTAFSEAAKKYELLLTPSDSFGMKGYVRLSYCISTEAVLRSLPAFRALAADYGILPEQE